MSLGAWTDIILGTEKRSHFWVGATMVTCASNLARQATASLRNPDLTDNAFEALLNRFPLPRPRITHPRVA